MEGTPPPSVATGTGSHVGLTIQPGPIGLLVSFAQYHGAKITGVEPTSAYKDKFEEGDCIVMIDGQTLKSAADLSKNNDKVRVFRIVKANGQCCVETCQNKANKWGVCKRHENGQCSYTNAEGGQCPNMAMNKGGVCKRHENGQCSYTNAEGGQCTNMATKNGGVCKRHARGQCSYTNAEGEQCTNVATKNGGVCKRHENGQCSHTDEKGEQCTNVATKNGGVCKRHARGQCSYTNAEGEQCTNVATKNGGVCKRHENGQCSHTDEKGEQCTNIAMKKGGVCRRHENGQCNFEIDDKGTTCPNMAMNKGGGRCSSHGDLSKCKKLRDQLRCIRDAEPGCMGFCGDCFNGDANHQPTIRDCDPLSVLYERMEKDVRNKVKPYMSSSQIEIMEELHYLRKLLMNDPFQEQSFSVNDRLSKLVRKLMEESLADEKYQNVQVRRSDNVTFQPLNEKVHMNILQSLKASLRGFGDGGMDYKGKLSAEDVNGLIDETIDLLIEKKRPDRDGMCITKAGSGGGMGSAGLSSDRPHDKIQYPARLFDRRNAHVALSRELSSDVRGLYERLTAIILLGLGIGCNIILPLLVSDTDNCATSKVYLMSSNEISIAKYFAEHAIAVKGQNAPPGYAMEPAPQPSPISTTASNTTGTTGGITDVAAPTQADSVQPTQSASHVGEEAPTSTEHEASSSHQDEADDEDDDIELDPFHDNDCAFEGKGERNTSPTNVTDLSTFDQQNSKATNQVGGNDGSKRARETAVINGPAESVNGTNHKRKPPSENIHDDEIVSPPKLPRHTTTVSNLELLNPPENAHDYNAVAQANLAITRTRSNHREFAKDQYKSRIRKGLRSRGASYATIHKYDHLIDCAVGCRVTDSDLVAEGLSQEDCEELQSEIAAND